MNSGKHNSAYRSSIATTQPGRMRRVGSALNGMEAKKYSQPRWRWFFPTPPPPPKGYRIGCYYITPEPSPTNHCHLHPGSVVSDKDNDATSSPIPNTHPATVSQPAGEGVSNVCRWDWVLLADVCRIIVRRPVKADTGSNGPAWLLIFVTTLTQLEAVNLEPNRITVTDDADL